MIINITADLKKLTFNTFTNSLFSIEYQSAFL